MSATPPNPQESGPRDELLIELRSFLEEAEMIVADGPTPEVLLVDYYGNTVYLISGLGAIYLFLPLFDDADETPEGREEARRYLDEHLPIPPEFEGMARYQDRPLGRTGLMLELLMPRRFSAPLVADAMDLAAETIERLAALSSTAN
jgi:hypothetical protein